MTEQENHFKSGIIFFKTRRIKMQKELKPINLSPQVSKRFLQFMEDYSNAKGYKKFKKNSIIVELAEMAMQSILEETQNEVDYNKAIKSLRNTTNLVTDIEELLQKYKNIGGYNESRR